MYIVEFVVRVKHTRRPVPPSMIVYCQAARPTNLIYYLYICCRCLSDVNERIESLKQSNESYDRQYEDHTLFKQDHDEQLLQWTQRYLQSVHSTCV